MEKSKEGQENGGKNDTNDTKEGENTQTADNEVAEKCEVECDTKNDVAPNVADEIKTDACQGPKAVPEAETIPEEPSVPSKSGRAQPTAEPGSQEDTRGMKTKADEEVKGPIGEALGKTDQTKASNSEEQSDPDFSQADPGTDQVEISRTVQYQKGGPPQTAADSPSELAGNKGIKEPNDKTIDAPTAQNITRDKMDGSTSNGTQEASPGSGGISDSNLEKLTKSLMVDGDGYSARSLGRTLGFIPTEVYLYCGYGKPKDSTGILRMLRAWKDKTPDAKQISGLLEALKKANLKHLAGDLRSQEGAEEQREAVQTSDGDSVTSPSKSVQPTTTRSDPLTDNPKSSPSVVPEAGPGTDTKGAPGNYSGQTDKEEKGDLQKTDSSSKPKGTSSKKESVAGPGTDTKGAPGNYPGQTDREKKGDLQKTDSSSKPKGTNSKKVESVAGPGTDTKGAPGNYSGQTDKEEKGDPQKTGSYSKPKDTKPPKVPCNPTTNPTTPDRNSGSKDPNDKKEARERKAKEKSEEEKGAMEQKVSKEDTATTEDGTKEDGPTKQKADEKKVEAGGTEQSVEGAEEPIENIIKEHPVSISVCTSAYDFNVQGLVSFLKDLMKDHRKLIKEVKVHALPYNDLDHYTFPKENPVDVMLLCHSINNRRFAITDVMDALYDEYLPYCARVVGKNKMGVIVHDFDDIRPIVQSSRMSSFKYKQPKAFETTSLQITCGHITEKQQVLKEMQKADREKLLEFLKNASNFPAEMMEQVTESKGIFTKGKDLFDTFQQRASSWSFCESVKAKVGGSQDSTSEGSSVDRSEAERNGHGLSGEGTSGGSHQTPKGSMDERKLNLQREASLIEQQRPGTSIAMAAAHTQGSPSQQTMTYSSRGTVTSAPQRSHTTLSPRRISVSVCSSAYEHNVKGFMSKLTELQAGQPLLTNVHFRSLPYNDIDSFRFPSNEPVDVMVLCHSVQNRGFSITNVMNALYEKYLQYCHDIIGKKKLAVLVHDFSDCKPKTLDVRMDSFRRSQPLTFELVDTVIVCGSLGKPGKIEMRDEDMKRLTTFFEKARYEPKENNADDQSSWKNSAVNWFSKQISTDK